METQVGVDQRVQDATPNDGTNDDANGGLMERLAEAERRLAETEAMLQRAERRAEVDRLLLDEGAIDLEAARPLAESTLDAAASRGETPDAAATIRRLRERKPFLFRARPPAAPTPPAFAGGLMRPRSFPAADPAEQLAETARASGDRGALLRYLRARRAC